MVCLPMKRSREDAYNMAITNMANYLMLLSHGTESTYGVDSASRVFECKTCNRQFTSFQALGGHRASHKKPRLDDGDHTGSHQEETILSSKPKSHKCSICGIEFATGQALGGHMRRHRAAMSTADDQSDQSSPPSSPVEKKVNSRRIFTLDLNLTPLENDFAFRVDEKVTPITVDLFL